MRLTKPDVMKPLLATAIIALGLFVTAAQLGPLWPQSKIGAILGAQIIRNGQVAVIPVLMAIALTCAGLAALLVSDHNNATEEPAPATKPQQTSASAQVQAGKSADQQDELSDNLDRILSMLKSHCELSQVYSLALEHAGRSLIEATSPEELRIAIGFLVTENNKMRRETVELQGNLRDSHERIEMLRANLHHAEVAGMRDALTNVWNRRAFDKMIDQMVMQAPLRDRPLSLILADIDHFKQINDKFGHQVGDDVLTLVAQTLQTNLKGRDFVARYGGEEFACLLPNTTLEAATRVAEILRENITRIRYVTTPSQENIGPISASMGVTQLKANEGKRGFIQRADAKLYEAKNAGRNRVVY